MSRIIFLLLNMCSPSIPIAGLFLAMSLVILLSCSTLTNTAPI